MNKSDHKKRTFHKICIIISQIIWDMYRKDFLSLYILLSVYMYRKEKGKCVNNTVWDIKLASWPDLYHLQQFLRGRQRDIPQETIQVLDVVLRATPPKKKYLPCILF